jgi:deoxyribodipyrimidine photolyase
MQRLHIVWFKRDLRAFDHRPLVEACRHGAVLPLVIVEPKLWQQPDSSARQWDFCAESLHDLRESLAALGQPLVVRLGSAVEVLELALRHGRWGRRLVYRRLCLDGWSINHKRVQRIWREEGLQRPLPRRRKRSRPTGGGRELLRS